MCGMLMVEVRKVQLLAKDHITHILCSILLEQTCQKPGVTQTQELKRHRHRLPSVKTCENQ